MPVSKATKQHRRRVKRILLRRNGYQFGQPHATTTLVTQSFPGDVACGDTSIQLVARILLEKWYSLNAIRRISGNRAGVPMGITNALVALQRLRLSYTIRNDLSTREIARIAREWGPVLLAEDYWAHPQWKGYEYAGKRNGGFARTPAGRRAWVGFAKPHERAGNNQWTFSGGHMVVVASSIARNGKVFALVRDSNHNSPSRPERPAWDEVSMPQLRRMKQSFNRGRGMIAIVPTRSLWRD